MHFEVVSRRSKAIPGITHAIRCAVDRACGDLAAIDCLGGPNLREDGEEEGEEEEGEYRTLGRTEKKKEKEKEKKKEKKGRESTGPQGGRRRTGKRITG